MKKKKEKKDILINLIFVALLITALVSGGYLGFYYYKAWKAQSEFDNLKKLMTVKEDGQIVGDNEKTEVQIKKEGSSEDKIVMLKKYAKLYEKNPDLAGWLSIDNTTIDYPVMYTPENNEKYIHMDFEGNWSDPGTPFIDRNCNPFEDRTANVLIYGHNMKSGIMFRELLKYEDKAFYEEHKYITFDTLYECGTYEVMAAFRSQIYAEADTEHYHYYQFFDAENEDEFNRYVEFVKNSTPYEIGLGAEYGDELITLSTCASHTENGRFVVVAKRIK